MGGGCKAQSSGREGRRGSGMEPFNPNFGGVPVAPDGPCWGQPRSRGLKLFGREIIFEEFHPMCSRYLNVTDGQTDRQTIYDRNTAVRINIFWENQLRCLRKQSCAAVPIVMNKILQSRTAQIRCSEWIMEAWHLQPEQMFHSGGLVV